MRCVMMLSILAAAQFAVAADDEGDAKARKQLVGVWKGQVKDGAKGHVITFKKDLISGKKGEKSDLGAGSFKLNLKTKPWQMDATYTKGRSKGKKVLGIYSIEKDGTLKWCVSTGGKPRPTKFETGGGQFCLILKKPKEKKE